MKTMKTIKTSVMDIPKLNIKHSYLNFAIICMLWFILGVAITMSITVSWFYLIPTALVLYTLFVPNKYTMQS